VIAMRKLWLFIYGLPNIAGATLGLAGLALLFLGVIKSYWPLIVTGLYGIGYLAAGRPSGLQIAPGEALGTAELTEKINKIAAAARKTVPDDIASLVDAIRVSVLDILAQAAASEADAYQLQVARQTVNSYLPDMLDTYARLPSAFAKLYVVKDGKTAQQILKDQLGLLDQELKQIAAELHRADMEALIVHGEFLKKKFGGRSSGLFLNS
jgi:hypothetical protein